jgi:hypothetical protein
MPTKALALESAIRTDERTRVGATHVGSRKGRVGTRGRSTGAEREARGRVQKKHGHREGGDARAEAEEVGGRRKGRPKTRA